MAETSEPLDKILDLMARYCEVVNRGLNERWTLFQPKVQLYDAEIYEVPVGLIARQATLTIHLASNPGTWTAHIAPLILRGMTDAHISLAWILKDLKKRARQYILYGLGQEKLQIAHLEGNKHEAGQLQEQVDRLIEVRKAWLSSQRHDFLTEVNLGSWSELKVRDMAIESDCDGLYRFAYTPFSFAVHSTWNHVSVYNLRRCANPLHKYHRVPFIAELGLDPDFVYRSAKYVSRSFDVFDNAFSLAPTSPQPVEWLGGEFASLGRKQQEGERST